METLPGIIHGNMIELAGTPKLGDGAQVIVTIQPAAEPSDLDTARRLPGPPPEWSPGAEFSVGGCLADIWSTEDDRILAEIDRERHAATFREIDG
jgi:hypothetical protein